MARRQPKTDDQRVEFIPNFRPFLTPITIPSVDVCAAASVALCISYEWMPIIRGLFHVLDQPDVWDTEDPDELFAVRQQVKELMAMGECLCGYDKTTQQIQVSTDINLNFNLETVFNAGTLDDIAPDRPDTSFSEDTGDDVNEAIRREVALCWAVQDYVTTVVEKGIFNAFIPDAVTFITAGGISFLIGPLGGLLYTLASTVAETLINIVAQKPSIQGDVACCMYDNLLGKAITEANFAASLDNCGFGLLSDEAFVRDAVASGIDKTGNFLAFVRILGDYMDGTEDTSVCLCTVPTCTADFTIDEGGFTARDSQAVYVTAQGWDNALPTPADHIINIHFEHDEDWACNQVRVTLINDEDVEDILCLLRTRDSVDALIEAEQAFISPGTTTVTFTMDSSSAVRTLQLRFDAQGFPQNQFMGLITKVEVLDGDCVFPDQPVV